MCSDHLNQWAGPQKLNIVVTFTVGDKNSNLHGRAFIACHYALVCG